MFAAKRRLRALAPRCMPCWPIRVSMRSSRCTSRCRLRRRSLRPKPSPPLPALSAPDLAAAERLRAQASAADRSRLTDTESGALLAAFGIPAAPVCAASTVAAARAFARGVGYPVVLEGDGRGAALRPGLRDGRMLERAWADLVADKSVRPGGGRRGFIVRKQLEFALAREARIVVRTDPLFGPVIAYG